MAEKEAAATTSLQVAVASPAELQTRSRPRSDPRGARGPSRRADRRAEEQNFLEDVISATKEHQHAFKAIV